MGKNVVNQDGFARSGGNKGFNFKTLLFGIAVTLGHGNAMFIKTVRAINTIAPSPRAKISVEVYLKIGLNAEL